MKKIIFTISACSTFLFSACNLDVSRQMSYDYDRSVEERQPSSGGKVQYSDAENGFIDHQEPDQYLPHELDKGTNLQQSDPKTPAPHLNRRNSNNQLDHE